VVSSEDGDAGGISDFEGNKEGDGLDGVVTSINVVTCASISLGPPIRMRDTHP
jgi:hypothetical protein